MTLEQIADVAPGTEGAPLHLRIKAAISKGLTDGTWKPGEKLPTEGELSRSFGVSEGTVRQAVIALVKEGRLTRRSGKGTFATRPNFERSFARFFRFRSGAKGVKPQYAVELLKMSVEAIPDASVADHLGLTKNGKVLAIRRAIRQDGVVVVHYVSYLSERRFGTLERQDIENAALYDVLQTKHGVYVVRALETLQARAARAQDAAILKVERGSPVIAIERLAYTYGEQVIEVRRAVGRSDTFRYEIQVS
jgi:GntR family transcriptional regulator